MHHTAVLGHPEIRKSRKGIIGGKNRMSSIDRPVSSRSMRNSDTSNENPGQANLEIDCGGACRLRRVSALTISIRCRILRLVEKPLSHPYTETRSTARRWNGHSRFVIVLITRVLPLSDESAQPIFEFRNIFHVVMDSSDDFLQSGHSQGFPVIKNQPVIFSVGLSVC